MARIIIEDMRVNKNRKQQTPPRKETVSRIDLVKNDNLYREGIEKNREVERIKEEKINEYFKNNNYDKQRLQKTPRVKKKYKILHRPTVIIFIICVVIGCVYWGGNVYQNANITITLKHQIINYNGKQFTASKDQNNNPINFEIMIISDKKIKNVILTDTKDVSIKAKGNITIYNEFSSTPQKLLAGTFVEDNNGKAYKIDNVVNIPGYKIDSNNKIIPGQVDVSVTSFLPGDSYNGSPANFFVTSFKKTPKYDKIYGKLKSPISGGAQGLVYLLDNINKDNIDSAIKTSLKEDLMRKVKAQVPSGYILYPDAVNFSYKVADSIFSKTPEAEVEIEGFLSVVLLKEESLIDNIIKISLPNIATEELKEITIPDLGKLKFSFVNKDQLITKEMNTLPFSLTGNIDVIWNPDKDTLKTKLLGAYKEDVSSIFKQDPGVSSAIVNIFPPWKKSIPNDPQKVNIITNKI